MGGSLVPAYSVPVSRRTCAKTPAFNLRVENPSRFSQSENQKCWRRLSEEANRETVLRLLGSHTFSHRLDPLRTFRLVRSSLKCPHSLTFSFVGEIEGQMNNDDRLGRFEEVVLLVLVRLRENAYGVPTPREIAERTGRDVSFGAVYTTLERLERKGYLSSRRGEPTRERGGRAKRYFRIEAPGVRALSGTREMIANLGGLTMSDRQLLDEIVANISHFWKFNERQKKLLEQKLIVHQQYLLQNTEFDYSRRRRILRAYADQCIVELGLKLADRADGVEPPVC
jgi:PadR family transcriptional regulator PadR